MFFDICNVKNLLYIAFLLILNITVIAGNNDKTKAVNRNVTGKVIAVNGEQIAGAKITIKETNESFYSDLDGNFKLQLKTDKVYSISVQTIGYTPVELKSTDLHLLSEISLTELQ
jgi:hypothetical protein